MAGRAIAVLVSLMLIAGPVFAVESRSAITARVTATNADKLTVEYSSSKPQSVRLTGAKAGGFSLPIDAHAPNSGDGARSAVMVLVDTSDPRRAPVVARQLTAIRQLVDKAPDGVVFGLAGFDKELRSFVAFPADAAAVKGALADVNPSGKTTELWRNVLGAVDRLAKVEAPRKAIFLFSDGKSEDKAYRIDDVVRQARGADVSIFSFGYAERETDTVHLQSLRRLSEETRGMYFEASATGGLPDEALRVPYQILQSGGSADLSLTQAVRDGLYDTTALTLVFDADGTVSRITVPVTFRNFLNPDILQRRLAHRLPEQYLPYVTVPYAGAGAAALGFVLLLFFVLIRLARRAPRPLATLQLLDGDETMLPILEAAVRIGRGVGNDILLRNTSVSEFHAQLNRGRDGAFNIVDLNSTNGVLVNGERVERAVLSQGDIIELGEVRIRFMPE